MRTTFLALALAVILTPFDAEAQNYAAAPPDGFSLVACRGDDCAARYDTARSSHAYRSGSHHRRHRTYRRHRHTRQYGS